MDMQRFKLQNKIYTGKWNIYTYTELSGEYPFFDINLVRPALFILLIH